MPAHLAGEKYTVNVVSRPTRSPGRGAKGCSRTTLLETTSEATARIVLQRLLEWIDGKLAVLALHRNGEWEGTRGDGD